MQIIALLQIGTCMMLSVARVSSAHSPSLHQPPSAPRTCHQGFSTGHILARSLDQACKWQHGDQYHNSVPVLPLQTATACEMSQHGANA